MSVLQVSVVLHKHIMTCERRLALSGLSSEDDEEEKLFRKSQMRVFREDHFVSPQYLYEFVRVPTPGVCYRYAPSVPCCIVYPFSHILRAC